MGEQPSEVSKRSLEASQPINNLLKTISSRASILERVCQPWSRWSEVLPMKETNYRVCILLSLRSKAAPCTRYEKRNID